MTRTFNATRFEFDNEAARLRDEIDNLDERLAEADNDNHAQVLVNRRQKLQSQRQGVIWARDHAAADDDFPMWDRDVDGVTLGGIRAGTYGDLQNDLSDDGGPGDARTLTVADGTVEAPYLDDGMDDRERTATVKGLHPMYVMWAEGQINRIMDPTEETEGNATDSEPSPKASPPTATED